MKKILTLTAISAVALFAGAQVTSAQYVPFPFPPIFSFGGNVNVMNMNDASVTNDVVVTSNTGNNEANGGDGDDGGDGGDATGSHAINEGGDGGNGGDGGDGGTIVTGNAIATSIIENDVNTSITEITIDDCGCEPAYNEYSYQSSDASVSASSWYNNYIASQQSAANGQNSDSSYDNYSASEEDSSEGGSQCGPHGSYYDNYSASEEDSSEGGSSESSYANNQSSDQDSSKGGAEASAGESQQSEYIKTYVPVHKGNVRVVNENSADVGNDVTVRANTGNNEANGGDGDDGGDGGDAAGQGSYWWWTTPVDGENIAGDGEDGGDGGNGGNIYTGYADSIASTVSVVNYTLSRVVRD